MFCKECGNEINEKAVICTKCGCATDNLATTKNQEYNNAPSRKHKGFAFTATGRASRSTFWIQQLVMFSIGIAFFIVLCFTLGVALEDDPDLIREESNIMVGIATIIFCIMAFAFGIYNLLLTIRRIHDFKGSGFLVLLTFIPWIGGIVWLVFGCIASDPNANEYGSEPDVIA